MKIRTDFVTNSSSSSFVAVLELQLENGKKVRATHDNSNGEDDVISYFPGSYRFPGRPLADMKGCYVKNPDQVEKNSPDAWLKIVKGSLRLMCHTYGEEAYRAYPNQMLPELGYEWRTILNQAREYQNEDQLFAYLRGLDALQDYTDQSLHDVVHYIMTDDYINDALIIQRLNENGSLSLSVETASYEDGTLFSLREPRWRPEPSRRLEFMTEEEYLRAQESRKKAIQSIISKLDTDVDITFMDKHFVISGFTDDKEKIITEIKKRGGYVHSGMVKKADYVVISLEAAGTAQHTKIKEALMWRESGSACAIVSDDQFKEALKRCVPVDPGILLKRESDALQQKAERQEASRKAAIERRQRQEERRLQYEANQLLKAEKERLRVEKAQAKAEKEHLAAEAKAQREQARQEAAANAVILYAPGEEPEKLRHRLDTLFEKLDDAYPDKVISGLQKDHKKWAATVTELYRLLGYPDGQAFLEAYGYTVVQKAMGRKVSVDPVAIMEELHRRYPNGGAESMDALKRDNPDIPWKTLANNAKEHFGNTLVKHLRTEGIL